MAARPRGLLVTTDYPPLSGGIARCLAELIRNSEHAVEWRVLTTAAGPPAREVVRGSISALAATAPRQVRWLRGGNGRFVACGHVKLLSLGLSIGRLAGAPVGTLVYGQELLPRRRRHRLGIRLLRRSDHVVAISGYTASVAHGAGVGTEKIRVVPPVFSPSWTVDRPCPRRAGQGLRAIAITRLTEGYKNLEVLFRAVKVLSTTGAVERLTVVGGGPRLAALRAKVDALGVGHLVDMTGAVDDETLADLAGDAHLGLFPSRRSITEAGFEGFGLVVQELAAAGLPVIVGKAAGALDAAHPEWSMLVDPDDLRAWVNALGWLAANEGERVKMAEAATAWAKGIDSWGTAQRLVAALR